MFIVGDNAHAPQRLCKRWVGHCKYHPAILIEVPRGSLSQIVTIIYSIYAGSITELEQGKLLKCELNAHVRTCTFSINLD